MSSKQTVHRLFAAAVAALALLATAGAAFGQAAPTGPGSITPVIANDTTTGTTANHLAKLTAAGKAVITATTDTDGAVGVVVSGAGTSGSAVIATAGIVQCAFDGTATASHYVQISASVAGDCHDAGAGRPSNIIGLVLAGGSGTGSVVLHIQGVGSIAANTILGATTAGAPVALTINGGASCTAALIWTNGTGFGCNAAGGPGVGSITVASNGLTGGVTLAAGTGISLASNLGTETGTISVGATTPQVSGSFTVGDLLCANNTSGNAVIDCGFAPISTALATSVYSNNTTASGAPAFHQNLALADGSVGTPTYGFGNHSGVGLWYNTGVANFAGSLVLSNSSSLTAAYKIPLTIYGSSAEIGIKSSLNGGEASIWYTNNSEHEWRVGQDVSGAARWDVFDNTAAAGVYLAQGATSWTASSDARLKTNVQTLDVLDRLGSFRAVSFDRIATGQHEIGVIAQELYAQFPELVHVGSDPSQPLDGRTQDAWGVNYDRLGAIALEGVKELNRQFQAYKAAHP